MYPCRLLYDSTDLIVNQIVKANVKNTWGSLFPLRNSIFQLLPKYPKRQKFQIVKAMVKNATPYAILEKRKTFFTPIFKGCLGF
jgi:hypothetical protein